MLEMEVCRLLAREGKRGHGMRNRYKKVCPFCKSVCESFEGGNLFCNCSAKYYWEDKVWLNRNTGEEVWESEDT